MKTRLSGGFALAAVAVAGALLAPELAEAQCSMCRTALEQNPEAAAGFNRAILLLLAAPYAVFGSVAGYVVLNRRRARRLEETQ